MQYLILCRSLTYAQRAAVLLGRSNIIARLTKVPQNLSSRGCSYGVLVRKKGKEAMEILKKYDLPIGKVFETDGTEYQEVQL